MEKAAARPNATDRPPEENPEAAEATLDWLLDSDPALRWQVMRDLAGAPPEAVAEERGRVATEGMGARPLALQGTDGCWGGTAWNRGFDSTMHVLLLLKDLGLDPESGPARRALALVHTTICVLEALWEHERRSLGNPEIPDVTAARRRGEEYLLERHLFHAKSTGKAIDHDRKAGPGNRHDGPAFTRFAFPTWWHYDVLRGLEYLRRADVPPDQRLAEAIDLVASKRDDDGRWPLEISYPGTMPVEIGEVEGQPSRWNTLRALRVLLKER